MRNRSFFSFLVFLQIYGACSEKSASNEVTHHGLPEWEEALLLSFAFLSFPALPFSSLPFPSRPFHVLCLSSIDEKRSQERYCSV